MSLLLTPFNRIVIRTARLRSWARNVLLSKSRILFTNLRSHAHGLCVLYVNSQSAKHTMRNAKKKSCPKEGISIYTTFQMARETEGTWHRLYRVAHMCLCVGSWNYCCIEYALHRTTIDWTHLVAAAACDARQLANRLIRAPWIRCIWRYAWRKSNPPTQLFGSCVEIAHTIRCILEPT